jgi:uncharacterized protein involved in outer membrane biogenesis
MKSRREVMKVLFRLVIVLGIVIVVLIVGRNHIVKFAVEKGAEMSMGLPLKIQSVDVGLKNTRFGIAELTIYNPKGFPEEMMFYAPEILVDYDLNAMLKGKVHLEDVRLNFDRLVIVKNEKGLTNIEALRPKANESSPEKVEEKSKKEEGKKAPDIRIDHLSVKVGKVIYKDDSKGGEPIVKEYNVNFSEELNDIGNRNMAWIIMLVTQKVLTQSALRSLVDVNMDMFKETLEIPDSALDTLKGTAETLKNTLKLPFGKKP